MPLPYRARSDDDELLEMRKAEGEHSAALASKERQLSALRFKYQSSTQALEW